MHPREQDASVRDVVTADSHAAQWIGDSTGTKIDCFLGNLDPKKPKEILSDRDVQGHLGRPD